MAKKAKRNESPLYQDPGPIEVLTQRLIRTRIDVIREKAAKGYFEAAHGAEDELRADFIDFIAQCSKVPHRIREKAELILETSEIRFPRDCA